MRNIVEQIFAGSGWLLLILSVLVEVAPVKIYPLRWIGRMINAEVLHEQREQRKAFEEYKAETSRSNILRFGDEVAHGTRHSQEHFEQILANIDEYEKYCAAHPEFKNSKTRTTTELILQIYRKCAAEHDFT